MSEKRRAVIESEFHVRGVAGHVVDHYAHGERIVAVSYFGFEEEIGRLVRDISQIVNSVDEVETHGIVARDVTPFHFIGI